MLWGWRRAHVGQTAILNWRRQCPWRHQDHRRNDCAAAAVAVISHGIKFLPASAFCAVGGRSLQRAADIFYTAAAARIASLASRDGRSSPAASAVSPPAAAWQVVISRWRAFLQMIHAFSRLAGTLVDCMTSRRTGRLVGSQRKVTRRRSVCRTKVTCFNRRAKPSVVVAYWC